MYWTVFAGVQAKKYREEWNMAEEKKTGQVQEEEKEKKEFKLSETWAQDALADLEDWIEEQGIYIRQ